MLTQQSPRRALPALPTWLSKQGWFLGPCVLATVAAAVVSSGATPPSTPRVDNPVPLATQAVNPAPATPLDEPLRLLGEAAHAYQDVRDYSCTLIKRERLKGQPDGEQIIAFQARTEPFSVHLLWQEPRSQAGQEVCYVAGKNNGQMRVHSKGLAGVLGFVSIDPHDARVMENSRHCITEAGIGNLIHQFSTGWEKERELGKTRVRIADYEYNHRACTRIETIHPEKGVSSFYRSVVYLDKQNHLPIRVENYDWPRPGAKEGELVEMFSFVDLRLNVGLGDEVFEK